MGRLIGSGNSDNFGESRKVMPSKAQTGLSKTLSRLTAIFSKVNDSLKMKRKKPIISPAYLTVI